MNVSDDLRALVENFPAPLTLADVRQDDLPLVLCNTAFEALTGCRRDDCIGRNCRFLQGDRTDPDAVSIIRTAIANGTDAHTVLRNYRKDGSSFDNLLFVFPIRLDGRLRYFLGSQFELKRTERPPSTREHADRLSRTLEALAADNYTVRRASKHVIAEAIATSIRFHMQHREGDPGS